MAKKRQRRSGNNFVAIPVSQQITLGTLADATVLSAALIAALDEDLFIISADLMWQLTGVTLGEGPIGVGVAHGDLTDVEIAENLNVGLTGPDDIIGREKSRRPVRKAGMFSAALNAGVNLNDGKAVRTKVKFSVGNGKTVKCYAVNRSGATLTTGAKIRVDGTVYGRWQR